MHFKKDCILTNLTTSRSAICLCSSGTKVGRITITSCIVQTHWISSTDILWTVTRATAYSSWITSYGIEQHMSYLMMMYLLLQITRSKQISACLLYITYLLQSVPLFAMLVLIEQKQLTSSPSQNKNWSVFFFWIVLPFCKAFVRGRCLASLDPGHLKYHKTQLYTNPALQKHDESEHINLTSANSSS